MTDHLGREKRSWNMSRIRAKDTKPEKVVRKMPHAARFQSLSVNESDGAHVMLHNKWNCL
jgi:G:T-mismatch repair DNA endonuclease (very short patch repair protein)